MVRPMSHERFLSAAQRVLDGDGSIQAAQALEEVILIDYPDDERFDELGEVLALYSPGQGTPYTDVSDLHAAIRKIAAGLG